MITFLENNLAEWGSIILRVEHNATISVYMLSEQNSSEFQAATYYQDIHLFPGLRGFQSCLHMHCIYTQLYCLVTQKTSVHSR